MQLRPIVGLAIALAMLPLTGCDDDLSCDTWGADTRVRKQYRNHAYSLLRGNHALDMVELVEQRGEASYRAMIRHVQDHLGPSHLRLTGSATLSREGRAGPARCSVMVEAAWPTEVIRLVAAREGWAPGFEPSINGNRLRHRIVYRTRHGRRGALRVDVEEGVLEIIERALGDRDPFAADLADRPSGDASTPVPRGG